MPKCRRCEGVARLAHGHEATQGVSVTHLADIAQTDEGPGSRRVG
jgi:hypothetical protein